MYGTDFETASSSPHLSKKDITDPPEYAYPYSSLEYHPYPHNSTPPYSPQLWNKVQHSYSYDNMPYGSAYSSPYSSSYPIYATRAQTIFEPREDNVWRANTISTDAFGSNVDNDRDGLDIDRHDVLEQHEQRELETNNVNMVGGQPRKRNRWKLCICVTLCVIIILLAIILPVLFLVRRDVSFEIQPINISEETINIDPNGFTIPVNPTIHTENENFFNIVLDTIDVSGSHPSYGGGLVPLGSGYLSNVVLGKRSEMDVTFPFLVNYDRMIDTNVTYFTELLTNCTNSEEFGRNLYLDVSIIVNYHMWAKSGVIDEHRELVFPCPISAEKANVIKELISTL